MVLTALQAPYRRHVCAARCGTRCGGTRIPTMGMTWSLKPAPKDRAPAWHFLLTGRHECSTEGGGCELDVRAESAA